MVAKNEITFYKPEAEQAVLGSMLIDKAAAESMAQFLEAKHFGSSRHRGIFEACLGTLKEHGNIDLILLCDYAKTQNFLAELGSEAYFSEIMDMVSSTANVKYYAAIVKRAYLQNEMLRVMAKFKDSGDGEETLAAVESIQREILSMDEESAKTLKDYCLEVIKDLEAPLALIKTGYSGIDNTSAPAKGTILTLGARPGVGKTLLVLNMIRNILEGGLKVVIATTEMTPVAFIKRQVSIHLPVFYAKLKYHKLDLGEMAGVMEFLKSFSSNYSDKLFYVDKMRPTFHDIKTKVEATKPDVLVIDNLSGMELPRYYDNKTDNIGELMANLNALSLEHNFLIILVCHLNRASEENRNKEPELRNLQDSTAIEKFSTQVLVIWEKEGSETPETKDIAWKFAKDRDSFGPYGTFRLNRKNLRIYEAKE